MRRDGFTLLEILVVVMIIVILATIVGIKVIPRLGQAKQAKAVAEVATLKTALDLYRIDAGSYPTQEHGLQALAQRPIREPIPPKYPPHGYLNGGKVPLDPWGREYVYLAPGPEGEPYEIVSYGADGEPGGEGENADVSSHDQ
ncbi:MAG: type II secretion system major pseudopilin GspG [Verrucomicrobiota bacterium]|nr:type II secretion system major pseudopilin GspG [Verrucomicrobiota bacterium]